MKLWLIFLQAEDGYVWLESAWDDESTAQSGGKWEEEVERCRKLVADNTGYSMRIVTTEIEGAYELFELPSLTTSPPQPQPEGER